MSDQPSFIALGLMSGTSLDGVDAAFIETDGERIIRFGPSLSQAFNADEKSVLETATHAALKWRFKGAPPNIFAAAEDVIHRTHITAIKQICAQAPDWAAQLDIIGFHGQTILHHPPTPPHTGQTLQLGDGAVLARATQTPVIFDFRSADIAAGGQGAPLAPLYHKALTEMAGLPGPIAVLNLGGVGNVSLITDAGDVLASDTGPANGPLDSWVQSQGLGDYDGNGDLSARGTPDFQCIDRWLQRDFFTRSLPRSADRYDFDVLDEMQGLSVEDGAATLAAFSALSVKQTLEAFSHHPNRMIICGGGRHNRALRWMLATSLPDIQIETSEDYGWDSDAIEAQAFAFLAVRARRGLPLSLPTTTGVSRAITGGRLARP